MKSKSGPIYFDYASTTPVDPRVVKKMTEYLSVDGLTVGVESSTPVAYCKTKDVSSASHGDSLAFSAQTDLDGNTIKSAKTYSVVNVQPDNTGVTVLILQEQ